MLAPIFCVNAEHQRRFPSVFSDWWQSTVGEPISTPVEIHENPSGTKAASAKHRRWHLGWVLAFVLGTALLIGGWLVWDGWNQPIQTLPETPAVPLTNPTIPSPTPLQTDPSANSNVVPKEIPQDTTNQGWGMLPYVGLAVLALFPGALFFFRRRHAPVLERMGAETPKNLREVHVAGGLQGLIPHLGVRELARDLRRRRSITSRELDIAASLAATLQSGGFAKPVFASRIEPEYLLLIDRTCLQDHQAALAGAFAESLEAANVSLQRWYFDHEPVRCRRSSLTTAGTVSEVLDLEQLALRYPDHRVVMFSEGSAFFDSYTGELKPWVESLKRWEEPVVFTLESPENWGACEAAIERLGISLLPLTRLGVIQLAGIFGAYSTDQETEEHGIDSSRELQTVSQRWIERDPPEKDEIDLLCDELRTLLGAHGCQWLAACAVYPEVHWGLTLRLGCMLVPDDQELERLLPQISRLLWMRKAFIPDWLRAALLTRLDTPLAVQVREALQKMLGAASLHPKEGIALTIAVDQPPAHAASFMRRLGPQFMTWLSARSPRQLFRRSVKTAAPESPVRDYVFLRFMSGKSLVPLSVDATPLLARLMMKPVASAAAVASDRAVKVKSAANKASPSSTATSIGSIVSAAPPRPTATSRHDVFVIYAQMDTLRVQPWVEELIKGGVSVFFASKSILPRIDWGAQMVEAIRGAKLVMLFVSRAANEAAHVMTELALSANYKKYILPILLEQTEISDPLAFRIAGLQHIQAYDSDLDIVWRGIGASLNRAGVEWTSPSRVETEAVSRSSAPPRSTASSRHDVFIISSRRDHQRVRPWVEELKKGGVSVFYDAESLIGGSVWETEIIERIRSAKLVILFLSPTSILSEWVIRETALSVEFKKIMLPILLEETEISDRIAFCIAGLHRIQAYDSDLEKVWSSVRFSLNLAGVEWRSSSRRATDLLGFRVKEDLAAASVVEKQQRSLRKWIAIVLGLLLMIVPGIGWLTHLYWKETQAKQIAMRVLERTKQMQEALTRLEEAEMKMRQLDEKLTPEQLRQRVYSLLEDELGIPAGTLARDLPGFASELYSRSDTTPLMRARAAYDLNKFDEVKKLVAESTAQDLMAVENDTVKNAEDIVRRYYDSAGHPDWQERRLKLWAPQVKYFDKGTHPPAEVIAIETGEVEDGNKESFELITVKGSALGDSRFRVSVEFKYHLLRKGQSEPIETSNIGVFEMGTYDQRLLIDSIQAKRLSLYPSMEKAAIKSFLDQLVALGEHPPKPGAPAVDLALIQKFYSDHLERFYNTLDGSKVTAEYILQEEQKANNRNNARHYEWDKTTPFEIVSGAYGTPQVTVKRVLNVKLEPETGDTVTKRVTQVTKIVFENGAPKVKAIWIE